MTAESSPCSPSEFSGVRTPRPSLAEHEAHKGAQRKVERTADLALRAASLRAERDEARAEVESVREHYRDRLADVQAEYLKAGTYWDTQRERLNAAIDRARMERAQAEDAETALRSGIEALADAWETEGRAKTNLLGLDVVHWRDWPRVCALRALLAPPSTPSSDSAALTGVAGTTGGPEAQEKFSGPVRLVTVSWVKPDGVCLDCDPDHMPVDDGGTYLTVRVPSQDFRVGLGNPVTLTIAEASDKAGA